MNWVDTVVTIYVVGGLIIICWFVFHPDCDDLAGAIYAGFNLAIIWPVLLIVAPLGWLMEKLIFRWF